MKTFPLHPVAVRMMPVIVIALASMAASRARAQSSQNGVSADASAFYEQGDEMSKRVGGFMRRMFYGEDRGSMYVPPAGTPPPQSSYGRSAPAPGTNYQYAPPPSSRGAPPPGVNYEYAPPPESIPTGRPLPRPSTPGPVNERPRSQTTHKSSAHVAESEKPRHREQAEPERPAKKHISEPEAPPRHVEESVTKSTGHRKPYTPPTLSSDDLPASHSKRKNSIAAIDSADDPPESKSKRKNHSTKDSGDNPPEVKPKSKSSTSSAHREEVTETKSKHKAGSSSSSTDIAEAKPKPKSPPSTVGSSDDSPKPTHSRPSAEKETVVLAPTQEPAPQPLTSKKTEPTPPSPTLSASNKGTGESLSPYSESDSHISFTPKTGLKEDQPKKKLKEPESDTPPTSTAGSPAEPKFPAGTRSSDHAGRVISPYPPHNELDVSGLPSGSLAVDPTTSKVFRVP